ncbi:hypothetical protein, variant [Aphanomyces astaci]|uniref:MRH domain-containing protein n=1 Tax=Aphanomyces astaci TaxID=112090 RepID=W4HDG2_APHAT|nr:hypothetical protein, variant [Aphanomyces astaci]ETV89354.1 hypothetical protein, variant [Aphanomyces astaci]|eukprot:XP_009821754.1 hypothetical protein, variant [Aphanomyces astaci]
MVPARLLLASALTVVAASVPSISIAGVSYVVRLHSSVPDPLKHDDSDGENPLNLLGDPVPMTSSNGKRYLCYVPVQADLQDENEPNAKLSLLDIARDAITRLKPQCLPTVETSLRGAYEICHGKSIAVSEVDGVVAKHDTKRKLGSFQSDSFQPGFSNYDFRNAERYPDDAQVVARLARGDDVYTQLYGHTPDDVAVVVQYACSTSPVTALLGRRPPNPSAATELDRAVAFVFGSRWFCFDNDAESINDIHVTPFARPSFESSPCVRRTEGWWTYEYCLGHHVSQFHREQNGETTSEFSLGVHAMDTNAELGKSRKDTIATEFLDDTYDKPQPAFEQVYEGGTPCDEVDRARSTRVLLFCPTLKKQAPYIISIQESATCAYVLKVAVPSLCDHPYFAKDERLRLDSQSQTIHCVPATEAAATTADAQVEVSTSLPIKASTSNDEL